MLRANVYLTEEQIREIDTRARIAKKPKAEILREVVDNGLKATPMQKSQSAKVLLEIAKAAKKFKGSGPKDLSINHDYYLWGGEKRDSNI